MKGEFVLKLCVVQEPRKNFHNRYEQVLTDKITLSQSFPPFKKAGQLAIYNKRKSGRSGDIFMYPCNKYQRKTLNL